MLKFLLFLLILQSANYAYSEVSFHVEPEEDPYRPGGIAISDDGKVYINAGSAKISIRKTETNEKLGSICCRKGKEVQDYIYLAGFYEGEVRLIYIEVYASGKNIVSSVSLYDIEANMIKSKVFQSELVDQDIAISNNGKYFSLFLDGSIHTYSSRDFTEIDSFSLKKIENVSGISVSNTGDKIAFISGEKAFLYDSSLSHINLLDKCIEQKGATRKTGFFDSDKRSVYLISGYGEVCLIGLPNNVFLKPTNAVFYDVFYDQGDDFIIVATQKGLNVHDGSTGESIGSFRVKRYHEDIFGQSKYQRPFFVPGVKYDPAENMVLARGSVSTSTIYRIKLTRLTKN